MTQAARSAVVLWREADGRAREAETSLTVARQGYADGTGPEPSVELQSEARLLRKLADSLLKAAIASLGRAANSARG